MYGINLIFFLQNPNFIAKSPGNTYLDFESIFTIAAVIKIRIISVYTRLLLAQLLLEWEWGYFCISTVLLHYIV
jgi:hypothetical protein